MTDAIASPIRDYQDLTQALRSQRLPAALLRLDILETRAARLLQASGQRPLRLLSSSLRCLPLLRHLLDQDPRWHGVLCHDPREAVWLATQGLDDIILSQPLLDAATLQALAYQHAAGRRIGLAIDDPSQIDAAEDAAREHNTCLDLLLDLNLWSLGADARYRSALREPALAVRLAKRIGASNGLVKLRGVLAFAEFSAVAQTPRAGLAGVAQRRHLSRLQNTARKRRASFLAALHDAGFDPELILGSAGEDPQSLDHDRGLTQLCVDQSLLQNARGHDSALLLALPVQRRPGPRLVSCSSGELRLLPQLPSGARLLKNRSLMSPQLVLRLAPGDQLAPGEALLFSAARPRELLERSEQLLVLRGAELQACWPTYRGQQQLFL